MKIVAVTGLVERHSFAAGRVRIEAASEVHHDYLIDTDSGAIVEFRSDAIENCQAEVAKRLGFELIGHRLVLYGRSLQKPRL